MAHRYLEQEWATCGTCGIAVPVSRIIRHPRWGWQCTGAPGANCFDGWFDADRVFPQVAVNEGVRHSAAPTVDVTEGIGPAKIYQLRDRGVPSVIWHFTYGAEVSVVSSGSGQSQHAWALSSGWHMAMVNLELVVQPQAFADETIIDAGVLPWLMVGNELLYTGP
jgi:hypothetical protein